MTSRLEPSPQTFPSRFPLALPCSRTKQLIWDGAILDKVLGRRTLGKLEKSCLLVYLTILTTKLGDFVRANVGKYSSTMEHMGQAS
jgi:hypothetical protein